MLDVFDTIRRGKRLKTADHMVGQIPYVSSSAMNNGVDAFIGNKHNVRIFSDCLSLANSGSVGSCFYHAYEFVASDHVTHLKRTGLTPSQYLFLAAMCVKQFAGKYNFNREINDPRIEREKVLLPSTDDGKPDFAYMDVYGREIMNKRIERYLSYRLEKAD